MTDLDELTRLLEQARQDGEWQGFNQAMKRAAEELVRDARRWRHAKAVAMIDSHGGFAIHPDEDPFDDNVAGSAMEKQIDAAIAQEQP
jgi:hypothetical protein